MSACCKCDPAMIEYVATNYHDGERVELVREFYRRKEIWHTSVGKSIFNALTDRDPPTSYAAWYAGIFEAGILEIRGWEMRFRQEATP